MATFSFVIIATVRCMNTSKPHTNRDWSCGPKHLPASTPRDSVRHNSCGEHRVFVLTNMRAHALSLTHNANSTRWCVSPTDLLRLLGASRKLDVSDNNNNNRGQQTQHNHRVVLVLCTRQSKFGGMSKKKTVQIMSWFWQREMLDQAMFAYL